MFFLTYSNNIIYLFLNDINYDLFYYLKLMITYYNMQVKVSIYIIK